MSPLCKSSKGNHTYVDFLMARLREHLSPTYYLETPTLAALPTYAKLQHFTTKKIYKETKELLIFLAFSMYEVMQRSNHA